MNNAFGRRVSRIAAVAALCCMLPAAALENAAAYSPLEKTGAMSGKKAEKVLRNRLLPPHERPQRPRLADAELPQAEGLRA